MDAVDPHYGPYQVPFQIDVLPPADGTGDANGHVQLPSTFFFMPASSRNKREFDGRRDMDVIERAEPGMRYLRRELGVPRLNNIHNDLWLAGRPMPPRPLNYQVASSRVITLVEDIHLHLAWEPGRMFLKPLPRYLLNQQFWREYLLCGQHQGQQNCPCFNHPQAGNPIAQPNVCERRELYQNAYGFLLSYTALIQYESDYRIAIREHLLPEGVTWEGWKRLSWELLEDSPANMARVNKRYRFGELRIGRLNKIVRVRGLLAGPAGLGNLMRGYRFEFVTYGQQLHGYLAPVLAATAYILLVLTAMQVGLATDILGGDFSFQRASYGFTVFSILAPIIVVALILFTILVFVFFNYHETKAFFRRRMAFYDALHIEH